MPQHLTSQTKPQRLLKTTLRPQPRASHEGHCPRRIFRPCLVESRDRDKALGPISPPTKSMSVRHLRPWCHRTAYVGCGTRYAPRFCLFLLLKLGPCVPRSRITPFHFVSFVCSGSAHSLFPLLQLSQLVCSCVSQHVRSLR